MLNCLEISDGQRVLELGTGTGYSAALLAHRVGAASVTTVEIDPVVADAAKAALDANGYPVTTVIGDAAAGFPANAPYDRVIATVAPSLGAVPYEWVAQTRPGGMIVTPVRTEYVGSGPLVRFTVHADGTATGYPVSKVGFMPLLDCWHAHPSINFGRPIDHRHVVSAYAEPVDCGIHPKRGCR